MMILLPLDFGSDPVIGIIFIIVSIIFYGLWAWIDSSSLQKHLQGGSGLRGQHWQRNRKRRFKKRQKELDILKRVQTPNFDDKYIYIMRSGGLYKVGISNNVIYRRDSIQKKLNKPVIIEYIGTVIKGRTIDTEQIIINELASYNEPVMYNDGVVSREWFDCELDLMLDALSNYADLTPF